MLTEKSTWDSIDFKLIKKSNPKEQTVIAKQFLGNLRIGLAQTIYYSLLIDRPKTNK